MQTHPITAAVNVRCPHCRKIIERVAADRREPVRPVERALRYREVIDHAEPDRAWDVALFTRCCPLCAGALIDLDMVFIEPAAGRLFDHPALAPRDELARCHLAATADARDWIMTRYETARSPLDVHHFTAMRDDEEEWGGCAAPPLDARSNPFAYAQQFVLNRWFGHKMPPRAFPRAEPVADDADIPF